MTDLAYSFKAKVIRVIDGDSALVDPGIFPQDQYLRVRFRDVFAPERGEEGYDEATDKAREMFPEGSTVVLTNTRVKWSHGRLEARIDPA